MTKKEMWKILRLKILQFFGVLFMEKDEKNKYVMSLGRVAFWSAFIPALYIWISGHGLLEDGTATRDISPNHLILLEFLIAYNVGKKVLNSATSLFGKSNPYEEGDGPG